ncbi:MAG: outer membrane lipoprotein carrier protein LolA [Gemmatimonadetes bacterium]|jgi:chaperone LolA|nr:outer membrane lipoprotein carrier protein LolA [Gemmatimonadota bacterium]MDE0963022.1 outer membrane lipoprotein carrier protein LolA [Candidatus Latescibacterota bacterium]MBT5328400.1 outer membrane lipoprotein carrier protein LolA [Gemmatimonadota bacterium]MBT5452151.1 outer membrane lipoprotein carrier protein LolA [Gemmatimonadota bacterium]MBT5803133.1 outer membrane lipoprotein carrier protein LolA [Gemmatimonadota bacterium]
MMAFWWIVLCWFFVPSAVMGITGDEIIAEVQERLTDYKTFSARFEKKFYWAVLDKQRNREGRIYLSRPDRFRIELQGGDVIVSDGEAIWSYIERNGQVVVGPYEGEVKTPWEMFFDYSERYTPIAVEENELDGRSCYLLVMAPENEVSVVERMRVWVDRKKWLLLQVEQLEANGNLTTYRLKDHRTNKKIDDEVFAFQVPEGVEVLDRRTPEIALPDE